MDNMPVIDHDQITRGIEATKKAMEVEFEGHTFIKPFGSLLTIVRRTNSNLNVLCRKKGWFDNFREFSGEDQFKQVQDWLDEMIGHSRLE